MTLRTVTALLLLVGCTGESPKETGDTAPVDTDPDDTAPVEPDPVWASYAVTTGATFNGVYVDGDSVYVAGTEGEVWTGGTAGWTDISPAIDGSAVGDLWGQGSGASLILVAPAANGYVPRWSGGVWEVEDLGTTTFEGAGGSNATALFVVSWGGIYTSDGAQWTYETAPGNPRLNDVYGVNDEAIAVGEGGDIVHRSGGSWTAATSGTSVDLNAVSGLSMSDVWAVGMDGVALHWDGAAWTATDTGVDDALWGVHAVAADAVYAVGSNGVALRWDGAAWTELPTGVANNLYAVHGPTRSNVWAVGNRGAALKLQE